jgi:hypothetical protein
VTRARLRARGGYVPPHHYAHRLVVVGVVGATVLAGSPSRDTASTSGIDPLGQSSAKTTDGGPEPEEPTPLPIDEDEMHGPGPVPMPHIEPAVPGPVPIPEVEPVPPGPVPMPRVEPSVPVPTPSPSYGARLDRVE